MQWYNGEREDGGGEQKIERERGGRRGDRRLDEYKKGKQYM